jgi:hypothetical protein
VALRRCGMPNPHCVSACNLLTRLAGGTSSKTDLTNMFVLNRLLFMEANGGDAD